MSSVHVEPAGGVMEVGAVKAIGEPALRAAARPKAWLALPRSWSKNGWTIWHLVMSVVMVTLGVVAMGDAWADIVKLIATDLRTEQDENTHILLVPIVAAWLVWVRRGRFRHCRPRVNLIGPIIMLVGWALYWAGDAYYVLAFWHTGAVVLAIGCLCTVLGLDVFVAFLPALFVLGFLVPVPSRVRHAITLPLEATLTQVTQNVCELLGMEVERSGNHLVAHGVELEIAEACDGMRMVFALVLVSFVFAFGTPLRWYVRLMVVAASPVSAIFCNLVRLVPTVWLYGYHPSVADAFHEYSGWCMLPIAFLLLMAIVRTLRWALLPIAKFTLAYD
jgi:exosortase